MGSSVMYWAVNFLFTSDRMKRKMAPPGSCLLPHLSPSWPGGCLLSRSQLIPWHLGRCAAWGEGSGAVEIRPGLYVGLLGLATGLGWREGRLLLPIWSEKVLVTLPCLASPKYLGKLTANKLLIFHMEASSPALLLPSGYWELKVSKSFLTPQLTRMAPSSKLAPGGECCSHRAVLKNDLLSLLNQHSPPQPAAYRGNESWAAVKIKPIFSAAAVNWISSLSSFLSPCPVPPFGVKMKAESCWEKQCSTLFAE